MDCSGLKSRRWPVGSATSMSCSQVHALMATAEHRLQKLWRLLRLIRDQSSVNALEVIGTGGAAKSLVWQRVTVGCIVSVGLQGVSEATCKP